jgi:plastocyanin
MAYVWVKRFSLAMLAWAATGAALAAPLVVQLRDKQGAPVVGAVVGLERAGEAKLSKAGTRAEMGQRDRQFEPRLLVVQTGTEVSFPNYDKVRHHVYSFSPAKPFELKLFLGQAAPPVKFDKSGVVSTGCNIHDQMSATIVVLDTPHFAISDAQGRVRFEQGGQTLRAWHPKLMDAALLAQAAKPEGGTVNWELPF